MSKECENLITEAIENSEIKAEAYRTLLCSTVCYVHAVLSEVDNEYYASIHEVAQFLGVKQPFAFTAKIRELAGDDAVIKGKDCDNIRDYKDCKKTVFVSLKVLHKLLGEPNVNLGAKTTPGKKEELRRHIETLCGLG